MKSWRTTLTSILGILGLLAPAIAASVDGNPATDPNWQIVLPAIIAAATGLFSRDAVVSSEAQGVK